MPVEFKHGLAYQHMEKGQHLERLGRMDEAMIEFKRAVEADPSVGAAHIALGHHYQRKGLLTKAADEFRSAALLSGDYESYFSLGRVLSELERYEQAAEAFRECLSIDPQDPSARYELALVQCAQGQFAESLIGFQSLIAEYPEDWELDLALTNCYFGMADYVSAERTVRQVLSKAPPNANLMAVREAWLVSLRHLEFPPKQELGIKERFYAEYGVVGLGSGHDNGLDVPVYPDHAFTYRDVAVTLSRMLAMVKEYNWQFEAIVSVDDDSLPIAVAASQLLDAPVLGVEELHPDDFALVVVAVGTRAELCEVTLEHMPGQYLSFALALPWPLNESIVTDFVGVACSGVCTLPWKRARRRSVEAIATSILRALALLPVEENLPQQLAYYAQHKLLRFFDLPPELAVPSPTT